MGQFKGLNFKNFSDEWIWKKMPFYFSILLKCLLNPSRDEIVPSRIVQSGTAAFWPGSSLNPLLSARIAAAAFRAW